MVHLTKPRPEACCKGIQDTFQNMDPWGADGRWCSCSPRLLCSASACPRCPRSRGRWATAGSSAPPLALELLSVEAPGIRRLMLPGTAAPEAALWDSMSLSLEVPVSTTVFRCFWPRNGRVGATSWQYCQSFVKLHSRQSREREALRTRPMEEHSPGLLTSSVSAVSVSLHGVRRCGLGI